MGPKGFDYANFGMHGGKHDLERWGIFAEMMYLHGLGMNMPPTSEREKGKQMYPGFPKWKTELQDCYFDKNFKRIFEGEALNLVFKRDIMDRMQSKKKFLTPGGIRPPPGSKLHSTPGDFYGTFAGIVMAFDPRTRPDVKKTQDTKARSAGGPYKSGLMKFPEWMPEKYDPVPNKKKEKQPLQPFKGGGPGGLFNANPYATQNWSTPTFRKLREIPWNLHGPFVPPKTSTKLDGMKSGCFSNYPAHSNDKYLTSLEVERLQNKKFEKGQKEMKKFIMNGTGKTWPIFSVANLNIDFRTTEENYDTMKPYTYTREFLHDIEF